MHPELEFPAFRDTVLKLFSDGKPAGEFLPHPKRGDAILMKEGGEIHLDNLRASYINELKKSGKKSDLGRLRELAEPYANVFTAVTVTGDWKQDSKRLMLQVIDIRTIHNGKDKGDLQPHVDLGGGLAMAPVLDFEDKLMYVRLQVITAWKKTLDEVIAVGLQNLGALPSHVHFEEDKLAFVSVYDGYAGARVLARTHQDKIGKKLGFPFHFSIPYRDFLICWSAKLTPPQQMNIRMQVMEDFMTRDHAVCSNVFTVKTPGEIVMAEPKEVVARIGNVGVVVDIASIQKAAKEMAQANRRAKSGKAKKQSKPHR